MRPVAVLVLASAVAIASGGYAGAQDAARERREERQEQHREEMFKMVDAYLAMNVEERLGLSDEQFAKVFPLIRRLQSDRRRFTQRRLEIVRDMKASLESGSATEGQIAAHVKDLRSLEDEEPEVLKKDRDAVDQTLTPVQQAKLRVLQLEVERKIRALSQRPGMGREGGRFRRGAPVGEDE